MSILERALGKLHEAGKSGRHQERAFVRPQATPPPPAGTTPEIRYAADAPVVEVDREFLCREGLFVPVALERTVLAQYRRLKRPILAVAHGADVKTDGNANIVMISSALAGEGKTVSSLALAMSFADEPDRRTLLVDADVAKPHISRVLGLKGRPGLIDALQNPDLDVHSLICRTGFAKLDILPAGGISAQATELLASGRMTALAKRLRDLYANGLVLIDSPPLLATTEAPVIASIAGQILIVVRANSTNRDALKQALSLLDPEKAVGLILNAAPSAVEAAYYGYGDSHDDEPRT